MCAAHADAGRLIACGRIGRAVGLKGECAVRWESGSCPVEIGGELVVKAAKDDSIGTLKVTALRSQGRFDVVTFEGIGDRTAAESLTNSELFIPEDSLPELPAGEYYCYQILGMEVETEEGRNLGKVVRIFTAGENDVYEVLPDGARRGDEVLIPAIADVVIDIDVKRRRIVIRPMKGMLE